MEGIKTYIAPNIYQGKKDSTDKSNQGVNSIISRSSRLSTKRRKDTLKKIKKWKIKV